VRVEVDDADAARPADLGDRARARPGDGVIATEDDRDRARGGHLADLAIDQRVAADVVRRDHVRVTGIDDGQLFRRPDIQLERVEVAGRCTAPHGSLAARTGARTMGDHVVVRRADDRDIDASGFELRGIGDPGQASRSRRADVGRQVEVAVTLVVAGPSPTGLPKHVVAACGPRARGGRACASGACSRRSFGSGRGSGRLPIRVRRRRFGIRRPAGRQAAS
jgi:hypothetical protein